ncbi:MAG: hypothetical protein C0501_29715 [Isosphaera sp.]|nr:hypothetical protein [Isosphaera sp.]
MERFWIQGVVRGGQVVLETPLALPDGTVVTVMDYDPDDDPRTIVPAGPYDPEDARRAVFASIGRPELADDPDWMSKLGKPRE